MLFGLVICKVGIFCILAPKYSAEFTQTQFLDADPFIIILSRVPELADLLNGAGPNSNLLEFTQFPIFSFLEGFYLIPFYNDYSSGHVIASHRRIKVPQQSHLLPRGR